MNKNRNTILIIDDEPEIRGLMQEILTEEGYLTIAVKSAKEAQESFADNPPDLVYLDIWMPEVDGITNVQINQIRWVVSNACLCFLGVFNSNGQIAFFGQYFLHQPPDFRFIINN